MSPSDPTHYEVLGVGRAADRESIRRAYIRIARASHPDRSASSVGARADAEARIRAANAAWNTLGDVERRRAYDLTLPDPVPRSTPASTRPDLSDHRPPPPSGIVVSASTASLWKWGPVIVAVLIGAALIIGSAYATSRDPGASPASRPTVAAQYNRGDCVVIVAGPAGRLAQVVPCDQPLTGVIDSVVDTPRPCPTSTNAFPLSDGRTTLCVQRQSPG